MSGWHVDVFPADGGRFTIMQFNPPNIRGPDDGDGHNGYSLDELTSRLRDEYHLGADVISECIARAEKRRRAQKSAANEAPES